MPEITNQEMDALAPYIAGELPDDRGEVAIYCPVHPDTRRSASVNFDKGVWYCHSGCGGGSLRRLVESQDTWVPPEGRVQEARLSRTASEGGRSPKPSAEDVDRWHRQLLKSPSALAWLWEQRGLSRSTVRRAQIGWTGRWYKIPVWDPERELLNVRTYDPQPGQRRKIWSVKGWGQPQLYPVGMLERANKGDAILWCEGEWDTLLAIQHGFLAVTRTGSALSWQPEWDMYFDGMRVFLCHDRDWAGRDGDEIVGEALTGVAESVRYVRLPFVMKPKDGKDLTDFMLDEDEPSLALGRLMEQATYERGVD